MRRGGPAVMALTCYKANFAITLTLKLGLFSALICVSACGRAHSPDNGARVAFESAYAGTIGDDPTGTFTIAACREQCSPGDRERGYVVGELVLYDDPEVSSRLAIEKTGQIMPLRPGDENRPRHNGCFRLTPIRELEDSYLGIDVRNVLVWERDATTGVVTFALYSSPDAGYLVEAVVRGQTLVGVGTSWGAGVAEISAPDDYILGRRTGPPNAAECREQRDR